MTSATRPPFVTVTPYGRSGASSRVRVFNWLDHLKLDAVSHTYLGTPNNSAKRIAARPLATLTAGFALERLPGDLHESTVILSKYASPFSNGRVEGHILTSARRGIYDFDDALMHERRRRVGDRRRVWQSSIESADAVIAGNEYLADAALDIKPRNKVHVIPSCVEPSEYVKKSSYDFAAEPRIIWIGSPSTEGYLRDLAIPLKHLNKATGARLTVVSSGHASLGELDTIADRIEWHQDSFSLQLQRADIGIMPLPNTPAARGKCAYKLLQYAATALPFVASPVGANVKAIELLGGLAAANPPAWIDSLQQLITMSTREREAIGSRARQSVAEHYSYQSNRDAWRSVVGLD